MPVVVPGVVLDVVQSVVHVCFLDNFDLPFYFQRLFNLNIYSDNSGGSSHVIKMRHWNTGSQGDQLILSRFSGSNICSIQDIKLSFPLRWLIGGVPLTWSIFGTVRSRLLSENPPITDFIPSGNDCDFYKNEKNLKINQKINK